MIEPKAFTPAEARKSTLVVAAVFAALGGWQLYRDRPNAAAILAGLAALLVVCAAVPRGAMLFNTWWMRLAAVLGYVNSRIILSLLYFLILTPVGFVTRVLGHDPLTRRAGKEPSYWRKREQTRQSREQYERAF